MPIPIKPIPDRPSIPSSGIDYSFLATQPIVDKRKVIASNRDADLLFEIWKKAQRKDNGEALKLTDDINISSRDIMRLKTKGFISGSNNSIEVTSKGKVIITTMVLGEENTFESKKEPKKYTEILASMNKRGKKGYRTPKFASHNENILNLKDYK